MEKEFITYLITWIRISKIHWSDDKFRVVQVDRTVLNHRNDFCLLLSNNYRFCHHNWKKMTDIWHLSEWWERIICYDNNAEQPVDVLAGFAGVLSLGHRLRLRSDEYWIERECTMWRKEGDEIAIRNSCTSYLYPYRIRMSTSFFTGLSITSSAFHFHLTHVIWSNSSSKPEGW